MCILKGCSLGAHTIETVIILTIRAATLEVFRLCWELFLALF